MNRMFEKLGMDMESLRQRGIPPEAAEAVVTATALRRAKLLGKKKPDTDDFKVAALLCCILPNWPKPVSYQRYIVDSLWRPLSEVNMPDEMAARARSIFTAKIVATDPDSISKWLYAQERERGSFTGFGQEQAGFEEHPQAPKIYNWEPDDDALKAWVRLRQASDAVDRVLETGLSQHDATLAQIDVLSILSASKAPLTPGEIACYTFRQQHSASAQLSRMRRSGLVKKTRSKKDQRVVRVRMQPRGEDLLKQTKEAGLGRAQKLLTSSLSAQEIKQLDALLKKVRDQALKDLGIKAEPLPAAIQFPADWSS